MEIITPVSGGKPVTAFTTQDVMGVLIEDLRAFFTGAAIEQKYDFLERDYDQWGALIREGRVPPAESVAVNKNASTIAHHYFDLDSRYFDEWVEKNFPSEIRRVELTKVVTGEADYAELFQRIANRNVEGFRNRVNKDVEAGLIQSSDINGTFAYQHPSLMALDWDQFANTGYVGRAYANDTSPGSFFATGGYAPGDGVKLRYEFLGTSAGSSVITPVSYNDVLSRVLFRAMNMMRANNTYTLADYEYGAEPEDLIIMVSDEFMASMDIKYVQTLFNQEGLRKLPEIRTYDNTAFRAQAEGVTSIANASAVDAIFILDRRTYNHVTRYFEMITDGVLESKSTRVDLHVEDGIKYMPFYKAWCVLFALAT